MICPIYGTTGPVPSRPSRSGEQVNHALPHGIADEEVAFAVVIPVEAVTAWGDGADAPEGLGVSGEDGTA